MPRLFISHASADDAAVSELSNWLSAEGFDDHFVDHLHIPAGRSWNEILPQETAKADIMIAYVTRNWLASKECFSESRAAYYGSKVVIPLLVSGTLDALEGEAADNFQTLCGSVQGISVQGFPPDEVTGKQLHGSIALAAETLRWTRRKRMLRSLGMVAACFIAVLAALGFMFREGLSAYVQERQITRAFDPVPMAELQAMASAADPEERLFQDCRDSSFCPQMTVLPAGRFTMGASDDFDPNPAEIPLQDLRITPFAVSVHEVTQAQWLKCFLSTRLREGEKCKEIRAWQDQQDYPVDMVSWDDAQIYVRWLNDHVSGSPDGPYRLLSEAEWEYAARGAVPFGQTRPIYHWGDDLSGACAYANGLNAQMPDSLGFARRGSDCPNNPVLAAEVGTLQPNSFGLYDTAGNLAEWVQDCWHDSHAGRPQDQSAWTKGSAPDCERVIRGGSWAGDLDNLRSAARVKLDAGLFGFNIGFRIARDVQ